MLYLEEQGHPYLFFSLIWCLISKGCWLQLSTLWIRCLPCFCQPLPHSLKTVGSNNFILQNICPYKIYTKTRADDRANSLPSTSGWNVQELDRNVGRLDTIFFANLWMCVCVCDESVCECERIRTTLLTKPSVGLKGEYSKTIEGICI